MTKPCRFPLAFLVSCAVASALLAAPGVAMACTLDQRPTAFADGQIARLNRQQPGNASDLRWWAPFIFARHFQVRQALTLTEDRRSLSKVLTDAAMRRPWRWRFGDGRTAYGWTVRHAYARAGRVRMTVDAYDPASRQWYNFDQVVVTLTR